jgi:hypothetical protein
MKKHIALGASLLLTMGAAVASTLIYGQDGHTSNAPLQQVGSSLETSQVSPEMIAAWKATAKTADYITPKVPI